MRNLPTLLMAAALLFVAPVASNAERPDDSRISNQYSSSLVSDHRGTRHDRYDRDRYRDRRGYYYTRPYSYYYYGTPGYNYYYDYPQYYDYYYYPHGGSVRVGPLHFYWR